MCSRIQVAKITSVGSRLRNKSGMEKIYLIDKNIFVLEGNYYSSYIIYCPRSPLARAPCCLLRGGALWAGWCSSRPWSADPQTGRCQMFPNQREWSGDQSSASPPATQTSKRAHSINIQGLCNNKLRLLRTEAHLGISQVVKLRVERPLTLPVKPETDLGGEKDGHQPCAYQHRT